MAGIDRVRLAAAVVAALSWTLASCSDSVEPSQTTADGLEFAVVLTPDTVMQHESFEAKLSVYNTRADTAKLYSPCSELAFIGVFRDGGRIVVKGTEFGCLDLARNFPIPPKDTLIQTWTVTAETPGGDPLPRGVYTFQVEFVWDELTDLEHEFHVR